MTSLLPFGAAPTPIMTGDSGSGGKKGSVPAPPSGSFAAGDFLNAGGSWSYVDQSKPINPSFSQLLQVAAPSGSTKFQNATVYTAPNGKTYCICAAGGTVSTYAIYDVTDQTNPILVNYAALAGAYNIAVATISSSVYAFVASSGSSHLYILNITNPYNITTTSNTLISGTPGSLYGVAYYNGFCYLATQNTGLVAVDVGNGAVGGTLTVPVQSYQEGGSVKSFGVAVANGYLFTTQYVTSGFSTRQIKSWSISTPQTPSLSQTLQVTSVGESLGLSISGNTAFVSVIATGINAINLIDITTPGSMSNLSQITAANALNSAMVGIASGNYLYIPSGTNASYGGSLEVYDITTRTAPLKIAQVNSGVANSVFGGIALSGGYIFVADYGAAPGSNGTLDVFTQILPNPVAGNLVTSSEQITSFTSPGVVLNSSTGVLSSAEGTTGQFLQSNGSSGVPSFVSISYVNPRIISSISTSTSAGSAAKTDYVYDCSGAITLTLPLGSSIGSNFYTVNNVGSSTVTVATSGSDTIIGSSTATLPISNMSLTFNYNSSTSTWQIS